MASLVLVLLKSNSDKTKSQFRVKNQRIWYPAAASSGWVLQIILWWALRSDFKKFYFAEATKGIRWMPWRWRAMKDVVGCEKPRRAVKQASTRGCPNGETRHGESRVVVTWIHSVAMLTGGSETSQYPEENKSIEIPLVAASERGPSPNRRNTFRRGCGAVNVTETC